MHVCMCIYTYIKLQIYIDRHVTLYYYEVETISFLYLKFWYPLYLNKCLLSAINEHYFRSQMFCENLLILTNANAAWMEWAVWCHRRATVPPFLCVNTKTPAWEVSHVTCITLSFVSYAKTPSVSGTGSRIGDGRAGWQRGQQPSTRARVGQAGRPAKRLAPEARRFREDLAHALVRPPRRPAALLQGRGRDQGFGERLFSRLYTQTHADVHITSFTLHTFSPLNSHANTTTILQVQTSCQSPNKRGEERVTCFLPLINLSWMMTCHGSSSNNGDFYPRGHAAGLE